MNISHRAAENLECLSSVIGGRSKMVNEFVRFFGLHPNGQVFLVQRLEHTQSFQTRVHLCLERGLSRVAKIMLEIEGLSCDINCTASRRNRAALIPFNQARRSARQLRRRGLWKKDALSAIEKAHWNEAPSYELKTVSSKDLLYGSLKFWILGNESFSQNPESCELRVGT